MQQKIIIKRHQYFDSLEEENIDKLQIEYRNTSFSTYDKRRPYLHIQVDGFDGFNFYLEMDTYQMERLIKQLEEQVSKVRYGF